MGLSAAEIRTMEKTEIANLPAVQDALRSASDALVSYRDTLQTRYGAGLKLRTYAIVSLAFERVLWEEIG